MKKIRILTAVCLSSLLFCLASSLEGSPLSSAFTYQGRFVDSNYAANGSFDFKFELYNDANSGSQIGSEIDKANVNIIDGYFTMQLDFGSGVFDGNDRWLEISVHPSNQNDPNYILLSPRQKLTPTPYAVYAAMASPTVTGGVVPKGGIIMWSGSIANIPSGWALCDGANNTPDLRNRFIVGAGSTYAVAATGGETSHTLTIDEMPAHTHSYRYWPGWYFSGSSEYAAKGSPDDSHQTGSTGGGQPHNNLPPYYALAYIMKL